MTTVEVGQLRQTRPNYWIGFLLNFWGFGGFAYINRVWPTVILTLVGNLVSGPVARLLWGNAADRWGLWLLLLLMIAGFIGYNRAYRAAYDHHAPEPVNLPLHLRLMGISISALFSLVIRLGYALGWLPSPAGH